MEDRVVIMAAIIIIALGAISVALSHKKQDAPLQDSEFDGSYACTMDAKLCPDGSYVGRIPPYCQFAPCPGQ